MAIKRGSKVDTSFSMSSMSDMVFLLLIFFLVTSTLVSPNALKLLLPKSNSQVQGKPITSISIDDINGAYYYYIEAQPVAFENIESTLQQKLMNEEEKTIALHVDGSIPMDEVVKVMNIAKNNNYKLILATSPE
ncbi:ExbD/TolR family protein [Acetobacteroides hydrogenigenes]|uniref:Biopolymer transport protein ExbD n=1 Tax=Acetobacteroides hydrogenigenes TaxID=979970 RepID=A0A4R2EI43_9BACT|nr:biopolymer transporter ExbD [Acetobacteroides hydrogenigenes]TCN66762.1 biopolymer transport protein ExbD [Acetobacteroides hydrogenigenes]